MPGFDEGADDFAELARNLLGIAEVELHRELYQAITDAGVPVTASVRHGLPDHLPDRYAAVLDEDLSLRTIKRTGQDPGIRVVATTRGLGGRRRIRRLEDGVLAHPLFGNRRRWYDQTSHVRPGWFSEPIGQSAPQMREAIAAAMHRVAAKAFGRP